MSPCSSFPAGCTIWFCLARQSATTYSATSSRGWHEPERNQRRGGPCRIQRREHPLGCVVVEQAVHPASDKGFGTRAAAQHVFPGGKRAGDAEQGFGSYE